MYLNLVFFYIHQKISVLERAWKLSSRRFFFIQKLIFDVVYYLFPPYFCCFIFSWRWTHKGVLYCYIYRVLVLSTETMKTSQHPVFSLERMLLLLCVYELVLDSQGIVLRDLTMVTIKALIIGSLTSGMSMLIISPPSLICH